MSADEVALASALLKPLAAFDMALAWALSGKALGDDKVNERAAAAWLPYLPALCRLPVGII